MDYRCGACAATHEVLAAFPIAAAIACPACGETARRRFGLGGLLGVRPARKAKEGLDRERAIKAPLDAAARQRLRDHQHGHDHHHVGHQQSHDPDHLGDHHQGHDHDHNHDHEVNRKETGP